MTRAPNALQCHRNCPWRIDLADQIDIADVDTKFQRRGCDQHANLAVLQFAFRGQTHLAGQATVVGSDQLFADALAQSQGNAFRQPPRVDEHQRRAMLQCQRCNAVINLTPHLVAGDGTQFRRRHLNRQVELATMPNVHHRWRGPSRSCQEVRHQLNRLLRCRQPNARRTSRQQVKPLQRQRKVRTAFVVSDSVNLVDDHRAHIAQDRAALLGGEQDIERLRCGDQDMWRPLQHGAPLLREGIAGAHGSADLRHQNPALCCQSKNLAQRPFEVFLDVVSQGL